MSTKHSFGRVQSLVQNFPSEQREILEHVFTKMANIAEKEMKSHEELSDVVYAELEKAQDFAIQRLRMLAAIRHLVEVAKVENMAPPEMPLTVEELRPNAEARKRAAQKRVAYRLIHKGVPVEDVAKKLGLSVAKVQEGVDQYALWLDYKESERRDRIARRIMSSETVLSKPVEELELSIRVSNGLELLGLKTVGEVLKMTEGDFLKVKNFGRKSVKELKLILAEMGLALKEEKHAC
jgi:DNA-directed RNA polymerase alpha subunit